MRIADLTPGYEQTYFCCLEDWSEEIKEAGDHKACWYNKMKDKGLRVKLALDDKGKAVGMIQYLPAELAFINGKDLYLVLCIWVHGYKYGVGNHQKQGIGKELLRSAEEDARNLGAKGLVTWGLALPFWMKASWFRKQGYVRTDKYGIMRLLWKPFQENAVPPSFIKKKKEPDITPGKVNITMFISGWCPAQNMVFERTRKAMAGYEGLIDLREFRTDDRKVFEEWGIADDVYIDRKKIRNGPPSPYASIRKVIEKKAKKIRLSS